MLTTPKRSRSPNHSGPPFAQMGQASRLRLCCPSDPHASPVGRNLSFYVDLYVRPLFINVRHSSAFRPNVVDRLGDFFPSHFFGFGADSGGKRAKQGVISGLYLRNQHLHLAFTKSFFFSTFLHYLLSPNKRNTAGLFILISILNEGGDRAESQARACTLNFTLIGMYKENLREIVLTQGLIHPDLFVRQQLSRFWRPQSFSKKSTQVLVHEAPGDVIFFVVNQNPHDSSDFLQDIDSHALMEELCRR